MNKGHSAIGASSASRWFACPGSVKLSEKAPAQPSSKHAAQGTAAHEVVENCLMTNKDPWDYEGFEYEGGELDEKDIEATEVALDFLDEKIEAIRNQYGTVTVYKEVGFDLSIIHEDLWGTADVVIFTRDLSYLGVFDYKHGAGVRVEVEGNKQLLYYLLGAINFIAHKFVDTVGWGYIFRHMEIGVLQPRCEHADGPNRVVTVTSAEAESFAFELAAHAKATTIEGAELNAGPQCRWCRAKPLCPQLYNTQLEVAQTDFADVKPQPPAPASLTNEQIGHVLNNKKVLSDWLKGIEALAQQKLQAGEAVPGYKLVKKRANRVWKDQELAEATFADTEGAFTRKLLSPAQMEKIVNKQDVATLCETPNNGNTIAAETDRRKAVAPSAIEDFKDIN